MHELSIMQHVMDRAISEALAAGARRVCGVTLRVGALSGTVPEALRFAFDALTPGTLMENSALAIESVPARFFCAGCSQDFTSETLLGECPDCGAASTRLLAGKELELTSVEIE